MIDIANFLLDKLHRFEEPARFDEHPLPVCPRKMLIEELYPPEKSFTFQNRYNHAVGKGLKNLVAETFMKQGLLWGDWRCNDLDTCGMTFRSQILQRCPRCHGEISYCRKEIQDSVTGIKVKVDGIFLNEELRGFVPYLISCQNPTIISARKGSEPYDSEKTGLAFFAKGISNQLQIAGRCIIWLNKANPTPFIHWFYEGAGEDLYQDQIAAYRAYEEGRGACQGDVTKLPALCAERCTYRALCFSSSEAQRALRERYSEVFGDKKPRDDI